jgi:hypothetical protein
MEDEEYEGQLPSLPDFMNLNAVDVERSAQVKITLALHSELVKT